MSHVVFRDPHRIFSAPERIFDNDMFLSRAQNNADGRIFVFQFCLIIKQVEIKVHLARIFRFKIANLKLYRDKTFELTVKK